MVGVGMSHFTIKHALLKHENVGNACMDWYTGGNFRTDGMMEI